MARSLAVWRCQVWGQGQAPSQGPQWEQCQEQDIWVGQKLLNMGCPLVLESLVQGCQELPLAQESGSFLEEPECHLFQENLQRIYFPEEQLCQVLEQAFNLE